MGERLYIYDRYLVYFLKTGFYPPRNWYYMISSLSLYCNRRDSIHEFSKKGSVGGGCLKIQEGSTDACPLT